MEDSKSGAPSSGNHKKLPRERKGSVPTERRVTVPFLETTLSWIRSLTPKKPAEREGSRHQQEDSSQQQVRRTASTTTEVKEKKILILHGTDEVQGQTMNLYEAFGTTARMTAPGSGLQPLLVVEMNENGLINRHLVPYKYSMQGKWLLYGRHIYILKGHSFIEQKSSPTLISCLLCVNTGFRMMQNYFKCTDCEFICTDLQESSVTSDCPVAKIMTQEMSFPYDVIETKAERVLHER